MNTITKRPTAGDVHVGYRVRIRRVMCRRSQEWLADQLGITFQQVQKYEKGVNRIGAGRLMEIAAALDTKTGFFLEGAPELGGSPSIDNIPTPAWFTDFMSSRDGQALAEAFHGIKSNGARRALLGVAQAIASQ